MIEKKKIKKYLCLAKDIYFEQRVSVGRVSVLIFFFYFFIIREIWYALTLHPSQEWTP